MLLNTATVPFKTSPKKADIQHVLCRDSGVILLASGGAGSELLSIWGRPTGYTLASTLSCAKWSVYLPLRCLAAGHWARGTLQQAYLEKNPLSALVAFAIAAGWDQTSFMRQHFCGRALVRLCPQLATAMSWQCQSVLFLPDKSLQVSVPEPWIDSLLPGVRTVLEQVQARNARLQSGKRQADDTISDRAAEGFLQTALYCGICFWQNLPFRTQR